MAQRMLADRGTREGAALGWPHREGGSEEEGTSSHQFAMFLQPHEGERAVLTPRSTGSSSSFHFNGLTVPLLRPQEDGSGAATAPWCDCRQGDFINVLVWDVSRKLVVSYNPLSAKS